MPIDAEHYRKLERLYAYAPVTQWYGATIRVDDGTAEVEIPIRPEFHHAAHAVHGSVYFRALDDAAFFAANSRVSDAFVLTVSFSVHFLRPVKDGVLVARGRVVGGGRPAVHSRVTSVRWSRNTARTRHWRVHAQLHSARPNCRLRVAQFGMTSDTDAKEAQKAVDVGRRRDAAVELSALSNEQQAAGAV